MGQLLLIIFVADSSSISSGVHKVIPKSAQYSCKHVGSSSAPLLEGALLQVSPYFFQDQPLDLAKGRQICGFTCKNEGFAPLLCLGLSSLF
jgi:hypothetical protein